MKLSTLDNFDLKVDRLGGGGSLNITHLMAFQEDQDNCHQEQNVVTVPYKRSIGDYSTNIYKLQTTNKSQDNWTCILQCQGGLVQQDALYARKHNFFHHIIPSFKGWYLQVIPANNIRKTVKTYLPLVTSEVTEFSTIQRYLSYLQRLSVKSNMAYVNVTRDVGAATNAYKTIWSVKSIKKEL